MSDIHQVQNKKWRLFKIIVVIIVFVSGLFLGKATAIKKNVTGDSGVVDITKVVDLYAKSRSSEVGFDQFWNVWDIVKEKYVRQPVNDVDLFYGAMQGMVSGLGDPYSVYFPPKKAQEFATDLAGEFEGIGAEIGMKSGQLVVIAPLPGSPAEKAGLKTGDKIFAIDTKETYNLTLEEAVSKIRGKGGTIVTLTVLHDGADDVQDVKIVRDTINVPTIISEMKPDNIGYVRITYFNENTWEEFDKAIRNILLKTPKGLVLDMRSNPGGYLETSVQVASEWVEDGTIVSEQFQGNQKKEHPSTGRHRLAKISTVVLVDGGTASGSEIVAGAIQDYKKGILVGQKTYGKGSVQDFQVLSDGSALKLTIAKWLTPLGRQIDGQGIEPDIKLEKFFEEVGTGETKTIKDLGLEKALELLKKK